MPEIGHIIEVAIRVSPVISALAAIAAFIFSLKSYKRLIAKPVLSLDIIDENPSDLLRSFKLTIRNRGKKSAEDIRLSLQIPKGSGIEIRPNKNVKITDRDSVWKGIFFKYPEWEGPQQFWRIKQVPLHPHQEIRIGEVLVHPDWPGWQNTWTFIIWSLYAKDCAKLSGQIQIPIGSIGSGIWVTRN
jgi:hypothetical protein